MKENGRYVPEKFSIISEKRTRKISIHSENERMKNKEHKLGFKAEDVKYIVVKTEKEILRFAEFIQNKLRTEFDEKERMLLISKLVSSEQIKDDM